MTAVPVAGEAPHDTAFPTIGGLLLMEMFLNPWYMIAGALLVSAPVLIHLINRIRYKRVEWAAMEFLLEAMKRNRRRRILEQLLLLLLRIFLVLLTGFLVARFVGDTLGRGASQSASHFILLDDSLSMSDRWTDSNGENNSFRVAVAEINRILRKLAQANGAQQVRIALTSEPEGNVFEGRVNEQSIEEVSRRLEILKGGFLHADFSKGLDNASAYLSQVQIGTRTLHIVSDLRESDWGAARENLRQVLDRILEGGINLSLVDVAHPFRGENRQVTIHHDNLALVDLKPESKLAAEGVPIEFSMSIQNFGSADKRSFLHVKVDGQEDFAASQPIESLPALQRTEKKFSLVLQRKNRNPQAALKSSDKAGDRDRKLKLDREFVRVRAEITEDEKTGILSDNAREIVVELRSRVPVLVVDGAGPEGRLPGGDSFHIEFALAAARAYEVEHRSLDDLEKAELDIYPTIYLANIPEIKSEKVIARLREFVERGGGLVWFLGDRSKGAWLNSMYEKEGKLFPLLVSEKPTDGLPENVRQEMKQRDEQPKILFPNPDHPAVRGLAGNLGAMRFLLIDRYYQARPRFQWDASGNETEEMILLSNRRWNDDRQRDAYKDRARELLGRIPYDDPAQEKFQKALRKHERTIKESLAADSQYRFGISLETLLNDPGDATQGLGSMKEFWSQASMRSLSREIEEFRRSILYGDPLVVGRKIGRGRVAAVLTSAGTRPTVPGATDGWNEWGAGNPVSWSYPVFLMDLQRHLSGEGSDRNRLVGDEIKMSLDASRYQPRVAGSYSLLEVSAVPQNQPAQPPIRLADQALSQKENTLEFTFNQTEKPGSWLFEFFPIAPTEGASAPPAELQAYAFNVDAQAEGDLRRAQREKLEANRFASDPRAGKVHLWSPGDTYDALKNRLPDASESPWLYLVFLLVLVAEQALAVHLSYHLRGDEGTKVPLTGGVRA